MKGPLRGCVIVSISQTKGVRALTDSLDDVGEKNSVHNVRLEVQDPSFASSLFQVVICPVGVHLQREKKV